MSERMSTQELLDKFRDFCESQCNFTVILDKDLVDEVNALLDNVEHLAFERGRVQGRTEIITAINHYMDNVSGLVDDAGDTPA